MMSTEHPSVPPTQAGGQERANTVYRAVESLTGHVERTGRDLKEEFNKVLYYLLGLALAFLLISFFAARTLLGAEWQWLALVPSLLIIVLAFVRDFRMKPRYTPDELAVTAVLERLVRLEEDIRRDAPRAFAEAAEAYEALADELQTRRVAQVDMLQFSGWSSHSLFPAIAKKSPEARVRVLLYDPELANEFDRDEAPNHRERIRSVVANLKLFAASRPQKGSVEVRYYRTPPSLSAVIIDGACATVSWYRTSPDPENPDTVRLRGHDSAAIAAAGETAETLGRFATEHFERLWASARPAWPEAKVPVSALAGDSVG